jgi:hypothetical protein
LSRYENQRTTPINDGLNIRLVDEAAQNSLRRDYESRGRSRTTVTARSRRSLFGRVNREKTVQNTESGDNYGSITGNTQGGQISHYQGRQTVYDYREDIRTELPYDGSCGRYLDDDKETDGQDEDRYHHTRSRRYYKDLDAVARSSPVLNYGDPPKVQLTEDKKKKKKTKKNQQDRDRNRSKLDAAADIALPHQETDKNEKPSNLGSETTETKPTI